MKQEIHLWNTALAPGASHHAHDLMRTTWCRCFFDCILHGCRRLISLQNMAHAMIYLLVDIRCVRMYDSLLIISCTLVHPHDTVCVCLVHSCAKARMTLYFFQTQNMTMIVLWVDPLLQNNPDYNYKTKNNIMEQTKWKNNGLCNRIHLNVVQSCVRLRIRSCAWSHTHDMMQTDLNPCFATRQNHEARNSSVKHCSGSRRITSCAWSHTHDMVQTDVNPCFATRQNHEARDSSVKHCSGSRRMTSCAWSHAHDMMQVVFWLHLARVSSVDLIAEHGACNDLLTCGYPLCSNVWLIAHHIVHTSSSAWHCMRTSCTFLRCTWIHTQNMKMIVLCLSMISKRFRIINQGTVECSKPGERKVNNIEEFVYALYGCTVFFVWLRLRIRWCAWSHTCDIMQANLNPWFVTR